MLVAESCPTLCNPMECSLPGFSVHGILQARILEWVVISFSRESSQPRSPALQADSLPTELQVVTCIFEDQLRKDKMTVHFFKNLMLYLKNNFIILSILIAFLLLYSTLLINNKKNKDL